MKKVIVFTPEILLRKHQQILIPRQHVISTLKKVNNHYKIYLLQKKDNDVFNLPITLLQNEGISLKKINQTQMSNLFNSTTPSQSKHHFYLITSTNKIHLKKKLLKVVLIRNLKSDSLIVKKISSITQFTSLPRKISYSRTTQETKINLRLNLDGVGKSKISTGIGFLDHMLDLLAKHANFDLILKVKGDLQVDEHHTIEDTAISLGETIKLALGNKKGINRYAFSLPMDESQANILLDISNRPYLKMKAKFKREKVGDFPTEMVEHFFSSLATSAGLTLHINLQGENDHHQIEAGFKCLAKCLKQAIAITNNSLPSTKGIL